MIEPEYLSSRIKDLSRRSLEQDYCTCTEFLSMSEQGFFYSILKKENISIFSKEYRGAQFFLFGGYEEADRKKIYFLPPYETIEERKEKEIKGDSFLCLLIEPKNVKFADHLTHRDYLGALMNLGFRRECFGDILTDGTNGYVFVEKNISEQVKEELSKVKHTDMKNSLLLPEDCPFRPRFEEKEINVASDRLDNVIAEIFRLSRRSAQEVIGKECVFVNGMTQKNNSYALKENDRVSVQGAGKFYYLGQVKETRKGRLLIKVKICC